MTEAAVKQHLLRLYQKFRIPEGTNRRVRLANEVVSLGLVRPLPSVGREKRRRRSHNRPGPPRTAGGPSGSRRGQGASRRGAAFLNGAPASPPAGLHRAPVPGHGDGADDP